MFEEFPGGMTLPMLRSWPTFGASILFLACIGFDGLVMQRMDGGHTSKDLLYGELITGKWHGCFLISGSEMLVREVKAMNIRPND